MPGYKARNPRIGNVMINETSMELSNVSYSLVPAITTTMTAGAGHRTHCPQYYHMA